MQPSSSVQRPQKRSEVASRCGENGDAQARFAAGEAAFSVNDVGRAFSCFVSATEADPTHIEAWYMAGGMNVVSGQGEQAVPFFHRVLEQEPDHAHTLFELGNVHMARSGEAAKAHALFVRSVAALERIAASGAGDATLLPTALSNVGNALNDLGRPKEATVAFERATRAEPPTCLAFNGLSNSYETTERYKEAQEVSARATRLLPTCEYAYYNLGRMLRAAERAKEAQVAFRHAQRITPTQHLYANGLGTALHADGQSDKAVEAYKHAIRLNPTWSSPYRNIGLTLYEGGGRALEALKWYQLTVKLEPTSAETYCDMGTAYLELRDAKQSMLEYERALTLEPTNALARANVVYLSSRHCKWVDQEHKHALLGALFDDLLDRVQARRTNPMRPSPHLFLPPYHALGYERTDPHQLRDLATSYGEHASDRSGATAAPPPPHPPADAATWGDGDGRVSKRLTVGYLTTDFGNHPTTHLIQSIFRIQHQLGKVRAICFARSDDGSEQRRQLMRECEEFVDLTGLDWRVAAARIRERRVAILVDLNGHCGKPQFEILSLRPAPIQISYMGHPGTSGAAYVQYVLVDRASAPVSSRSHFTEHFLTMHMWHVTDYRFAHAFEALGAPPAGSPPIGKRLAWPDHATRDALGLPAKGFVLATFNQLYKVTPTVYTAWLNTLRRHATSRLWLLQFPDIASANLQNEAAAIGVWAKRLLSAPTADRTFHLARVSLADLHLDTSPYNGHTTVGDTTWMGVPTLATPGGMMQSRVSLSYATNAGCPQLNAHSHRWYEEMASDLVARPSAIAKVRACLAAHRWTSAAFDTRRWVQTFDAGARAMWEVAHHRGADRPMHILLPAQHVTGVR